MGVLNVAPTVTLSASNDLSVDEGSTTTYSFSIFDPGVDDITGTGVSCGAPVATGVTFNNTSGSFTCTYPDGDASRTLLASATDSDGGTSAFDSQVVTVNNVAPTIAISGAASVNEGSPTA